MLRAMMTLKIIRGTGLLLPIAALLPLAAGSAMADYIEPTIDSIHVSDNLPISVPDLLEGSGLRAGVAQYEVTSRGVRESALSNLMSEGYLEAAVSVSWPSWTDETAVVEIVVDAGGRSILGAVAIVGNELFSARTVAGLLPLRPGDVVTPAALAEMEQSLLELYRHHGYVHALVSVSPMEHTGAPGDTADIIRTVECTIEEGDQHYLGAVSVDGLETVRKKVVLREIPLVAGDSLDMRILRQSISDIYGLGLFHNVRFGYDGLDEERDTIDVLVTVSERDYRTVDIGGGYISPSALTASVYWNHPNLFGNNQRLHCGARVIRYLSTNGGDELEPEISYEEPYFISTRWTARLKVNYLYKEMPGLGERSYGIEATFTRRYGRSLEWQLGYRVERSRFRQEDIEEDWTTSAIVSTSLIHDTRSDPFSPTNGHRLSGGADLAGFLVGGRNYYRLTAEARVFKAIKRDFVLAWRIGCGRVEPYGDDDEVEPDDRFFLGGGTTVRGYGFNDLGPEDDEGNSIGGRIMLLGNLEVRLRVIGALGFVLFADTGGLWDSVSDISLDNMGLGTGMGLRFRTPFGPLRLDYGFAPTWRDGLRRGRAYLALGHAF